MKATYPVLIHFLYTLLKICLHLGLIPMRGQVRDGPHSTRLLLQDKQNVLPYYLTRVRTLRPLLQR